MNGREKSDPVIVAVKSPNKTGEPAAEAMERRVGAEENARQRRTRRTQSRESVTPTPERVRTAARFCRHYPRWEPDAGKPHVRICAGGPGQPGSLPRYSKEVVAALDRLGNSALLDEEQRLYYREVITATRQRLRQQAADSSHGSGRHRRKTRADRKS